MAARHTSSAVMDKRLVVLLNVGVTTLTERVPTATPGDDRGEEAKLRWEWVLESGGVGRWGMMGAGSGREGGDAS